VVISSIFLRHDPAVLESVLMLAAIVLIADFLADMVLRSSGALHPLFVSSSFGPCDPR
jgi:hypothetical protein